MTTQQDSNPQLLDHRAHRPRQIARWPIASSRSPAPSPSARARDSSSTRWTSSASAGSRSRRRPSASSSPAQDGAALPAEPHRHARPRRLQLRGLAQPRRVRGGASSSSTRRRASRRRRSRTSTSRIDQGLEILPVLNKVDLPSLGRRADEGADRAGRRPRLLRGHRGERQDRRRRPRDPRADRQARSRRPKGKPDAPLRALIFDTWYDTYRGAVVMVRVVDGTPEEGRQDPLHGRRGRDYEVTEMGVFQPFAVAARRARPGRGRLPRREHQERPRHEARRHGDPRRQRAGQAARTTWGRRPSRSPASRT